VWWTSISYEHFTGTQGANWLEGKVQLEKQPTPFQVVFQGVHKSGAYGDIAIDDFRISACKPSPGNIYSLLVGLLTCKPSPGNIYILY